MSRTVHIYPARTAAERAERIAAARRRDGAARRTGTRYAVIANAVREYGTSLSEV